MQNKRLETIVSLLKKTDHLIDIGCDHAYVCIELAKKGSSKILATDIHEKALNHARKNIEKSGFQSVISCQVSDGLEKIDPKDFNTIVIAGMGTSTIKHILSDQKKLESIQKIIVQSNNDIPKLRLFMNKLGYAIKKEIIISEKKHYYTILLYQKGKQKLKKRDVELGFYQKKFLHYYCDLRKKYEAILREIPKKKIKKRLKLKKKIKWLTKWINL